MPLKNYSILIGLAKSSAVQVQHLCKKCNNSANYKKDY